MHFQPKLACLALISWVSQARATPTNCQPCGEYCIGPETICCAYDSPYQGHFMCPLDYVCGPNMECRPPSPASSSISGTPVCPDGMQPCGARCVSAADTCCEDGETSCQPGLICVPSPVYCRAPKEGEDATDTCTSSSSLHAGGHPSTAPASPTLSETSCTPTPRPDQEHGTVSGVPPSATSTIHHPTTTLREGEEGTPAPDSTDNPTAIGPSTEDASAESTSPSGTLMGTAEEDEPEETEGAEGESMHLQVSIVVLGGAIIVALLLQ